MIQPCLICGKVPRPVYRETAPDEVAEIPYGATMFMSHGHYGSTVFDDMGRTFLRVTICDEHLLDYARQGRVLHAIEVRQPRPEPEYKPWDVSDMQWCERCGRAVGIVHDRHDDEPPF